MAGIVGELCTNQQDLKRVASKRRKEYVEESVTHGEVETYERKDWTVVRRSKTKTRMRKSKPPDVLFEDRLWMIFYNLGFTCMNKDRNCKLKFNSLSKQVDVLARNGDNVFVIECKSSGSDESINARSALEYWVGKRRDTQRALRTTWGHNCGRINMVVAVSSTDKRYIDEIYASEIRDKNIFLWSAREISYIEALVRQVGGSSAKYQLYSVIFADKKQKRLKRTYPAIKGKIGGHVFYTFLISAKDLLKYAYVHHRNLTGIVETSQAYQRMLKKAKLDQITKFIDKEDGYFPNSIIVSLSKSVRWDKTRTFGKVQMGTITLPEYFGSAWIIDGQHRLYGAVKAKNDILVPVLAFENMEQIDQANLFVEINEKQTSVQRNLLWDLYSDIYRDSTDEKQKLRLQIAETVKKLDTSGPLKGYIDIPSMPKERPVKLTLTTVCDTIEKYSPWDHIKHPTDESETPENAARVINSYFGVLKSLWSEDWAKGNKSVLLSNNGFSVFIMVFQDIVNHIVYKQKHLLLQASRTKEFEELLRSTYLTPLIEFLRNAEEMQNDIRSQTGRGPQNYNAALLDLKIQEFVPDYSPPRTGGLPTVSAPKEPPAISTIEERARLAERCLRDFILEKLKRNYGSNKWWKQGVSGGPKRKADDIWKAEVARKPYLQREEKKNEYKFEFLGLGDITNIVVYGQNWDQVFEPVFIDKTNFERRIKDITALRNPSSHARKIDDQDVADGISGLLWLSNCIGVRDLNPYA